MHNTKNGNHNGAKAKIMPHIEPNFRLKLSPKSAGNITEKRYQSKIQPPIKPCLPPNIIRQMAKITRINKARGSLLDRLGAIHQSKKLDQKLHGFFCL